MNICWEPQPSVIPNSVLCKNDDPVSGAGNMDAVLQMLAICFPKRLLLSFPFRIATFFCRTGAGNMDAVLQMLGSEAAASTRLALLEVVPSAAPAARRHLARSRAVMGALNAWAGTWAGKDDDPLSLEALLKVSFETSNVMKSFKRQPHRHGRPETPGPAPVRGKSTTSSPWKRCSG